MSTEAYDALAPHYREYAANRAVYLSAVDDFIVEYGSRGGLLLDVGAGDGVRGMGLARRLAASSVVLCEPSPSMAALCRTRGTQEVWEVEAQCLPDSEHRFDVITCLWNVLGHLPEAGARVLALKAMARLLARSGSLFFDVNNRHNARSYGRVRVAGRRILDAIAPDERRGDTAYDWHVAGQAIPSKGHLFTPAECERLITLSGLVCMNRMAIDYVTGARSDSPFEGQLLFQVCTNTEAA